MAMSIEEIITALEEALLSYRKESWTSRRGEKYQTGYEDAYEDIIDSLKEILKTEEPVESS